MKEKLALKFLRSANPRKSDKELVDRLAELLGVNNNPLEQIHELEDEPGNCYLWQMDMTDEQIIEFNQQLKSKFVRSYNRDPQALHIVRNDVQDLTELSPGEVKEQVKPWLDDGE